MTPDAIRSLFQAKPFTPFIIHLADGRKIPVPSPEFMWYPPAGRLVFVSQGGDAFHIVDLLLVTGLEMKTNPPPDFGNGK